MIRCLLLSLWLGFATSLGACGDSGSTSGSGPVARFSLTPGADFFSQPFPSDLRRLPGGGIDLSGFESEDVIVSQVIAAAEEAEAFSVGGAIYFTFSAAVDVSTLPSDGAETLEPQASVYVVNVDPTSPGYGERVPLWIRFEDEPSRFISAHWLALLPYPGAGLRTGTTYAAVVTRRLHAVTGEPFGRDGDFGALLGGSERSEVVAARATFAPLLEYLADASRPIEEVVAATVFTTERPGTLLRRAREVIYRDVAPPEVSDLSLVSQDNGYNLYEGTFEGPIFQQGDAPYRNAGGEIRVDEQGDPVLSHMETLRVALAVPTGAMPAAGWPVTIYRHGTGGDYLSFAENGTGVRLAAPVDSDGSPLAPVAVISMDGVVHGPRAGASGGSPETLFYNFQNPWAGRDNSRQEAIDNFQLLRLVDSVNVSAAPETGQPIRFDPDHVYFFGHSQGAITGALFVPFEPRLRAAILSGAGANLILTLLRKKSELDIEALLEIALDDPAYGPLDEFHPVLTVLQTFIEPADPLAYAQDYFASDEPGVGAPSLFLTYGRGDSYTPNLTTRVLAETIGAAPAGEVLDSYEAYDLLGGVSPLALPVCDNLSVDGGHRTAVVVQYEPWPGSDGHFVVFDERTARRQAAAFLATEATVGCATLLP